MKHQITLKLISASVVALASISQAATTVTFNNMVADAASVTAGGNAYTVAIDETGTDLLYNFSYTGNIDGGTVDDTFSFTLVDKAYSGSTYDTGTVTLGTAVDNNVESNGTGAIHFGNNLMPTSNPYLTTGDSFVLSMTSMSYVSGETGTGTAAFNGFTALDIYVKGSGATYVLGQSGTEVTPTVNGSLVNLGSTPEVLLTQTSSTGTAALRFRNLDFSFEVDSVPEPSSTALLGLGFVGLMLRRQR